MKSTRTKLKIAGRLLALLILITTLGAFAMTALAVEGDLCTSTDSCTGTYATGFCSVCNGYESAALNADGYYEIGNAGQLFWFAQQVNVEGNREIKGVLTDDIDLEDRPWTPIGVVGEESNHFCGVFDGQNHTIRGLDVKGSENGVGFFGEVRTGTVRNFTIYGEVVVNAEVDYVGGVIGSICGVNGENDLYRNGAIIQNITSYVNVTTKAHGVGMIGGFVGYANHQSLIETCSWYGTFDAGNYCVDSGAGGFIGKIQENTSEVTIRNCAAYGTIKTGYAGDISIGGFLGLSDTGAKTTIENCLFAGKFERGANLTDEAELAAFGTLRSVNAIKNCYYLGDGVLAAVHSDSPLKPGSDNVEITSVTKAQLLSGEVAYKLGEHFGQTLEGENRQSYPVLGGTKVKDSQRFEIYDQQLNVGGDLSMKYYVMGYAPEFNSKGLYMEFSHNGVKTKVYAGEPNADGFYVFILEGINPQCMGDNIYAMLFYNETEVAMHGYEKGKEYSVEKNLLNLLEKYKDNAALVALIKDILAYGEAASAYKNHQTMTGNAYIENSSNREIPVSEADRFEIEPNMPLVEQYTVGFGTKPSIKIRVRYLPEVKVYVNEKEYVTTEEDVNRGYIIFESDPISATDFDKDFSVSIQNDEGKVCSYIHVSVNDYLYAISQSTDASDEMKALAKVLYNYGFLSAHQYRGIHTGGEATCTHGKFCDICGFEYDTAKAPDNHVSENYTYTDNGDGTHTKTHECGVTVGEPEVHSFTYSEKDNVITAVCSANCGYSETATISAEDTTYNGTEQKTATVTYSDGWKSDELNVSYEDNVNAGTVTASITVGEATASTTFTIAPKELTLSLTSYGKEYDGTNVLTSYEANVEGFIFYDEGSYESDTLDYDDVYDDVSVAPEKLTVTLPDCVPGVYETAKVSGITLIGETAQNYTLAETLEAVPISDEWGDPFRISEATVTVTSRDQNVAQGAELDQNAYTLEGLPQGHQIQGVKLERDGIWISVLTDDIEILNALGQSVTDYFRIKAYSEGILTETCVGHSFDANGFCATGMCQVYQAAKINDNGTEDEYDDYYEIANAGQLYWYAQQINDIGLSAGAVLTANIVVPENAPNWVPIGNVSAYCAAFDGQNNTISGLKCETTGNYAGLFGYTDYNYTIQNIGILNSSFKGTENVGALIGCAYTTVMNCYALNTTVEGTGTVGGLVGHNGGSVTNSYAYSSSCVGSYNSSYGTVENCYYLSETETEDGGKTAAQFKSGEVAYLLQSGVSEEDIYDDEGNHVETVIPKVWGQSIGTDSAPVLGGEQVYKVRSCDGESDAYSNTQSTETPQHTYGTPVYSWTEDPITLTVTVSCTACGKTFTGSTTDMDVTISDDGFTTTYTASVTLDGKEYTDSKVVSNKVTSVNITWGDMDFTYTDESGWNNPDTAWVQVENTGNTSVTVTYNYVTERTDITGSFFDGTDAVTAPVAIKVKEAKKIWLRLDRRPSEALRNTKIGSVKLIIE